MSNFNLIEKGESLFKKKDFVKSLDTFFVVLRNNPKSIDALTFISYIYIETGNYKNALIYLDKLVNLDWNILSRKAAGIKYALDLLGFIGGNPRKPQNNLTEFDRKSISEAIENSGIKEVE